MKYFIVKVLLIMCLYALASSCSKTCGGHVKFGNPSEADQVLCREAYAVGYSHHYRNPRWAAYYVDAEAMLMEIPETNNYRYDEQIKDKGRIHYYDYMKINYAMVRLADGRIVTNEDAMDETYLISNTVPQLPAFNRTLWQLMNDYETKLIEQHGAAYVVTGTVYSGFNRTVGERNWAIASHFYKVFYFPESDLMRGFLLPHENVPNADILDYETTVDEIEMLSDLNFFHKMLNEDEDRLEAIAPG